MNKIHYGRMDLNLLTIFDSLYRHRNTTKAGEELHMSQSAVSHALNRLRDMLDDPLFVRVPKGMLPTAFADRIAPSLQDVFEKLQTVIVNEKTFSPKTATGNVTVGVSQMNPLMFLPSLYAQLSVEAPGINMRIQPVLPEHYVRALDEQIVDMLVVIDGANSQEFPSRIHSQAIFEDELVCVVDRENPLIGLSLDFTTFAKLPHLVLATGPIDKTWIDELIEARNLTRRIALIAPLPQAIEQVVPDSLLICTVAKSLVAPYLTNPKLRVLPAPFTWQEPHQFVQLWHSRSHSDPAQRWLRKLVFNLWD